MLNDEIKDILKELVKKYECLAQVRTIFFIEDVNNIIKAISKEPINPTRLEEVQLLYKQKYWTIPMRYKNDIQRLSSKL